MRLAVAVFFLLPLAAYGQSTTFTVQPATVRLPNGQLAPVPNTYVFSGTLTGASAEGATATIANSDGTVFSTSNSIKLLPSGAWETVIYHPGPRGTRVRVNVKGPGFLATATAALP